MINPTQNFTIKSIFDNRYVAATWSLALDGKIIKQGGRITYVCNVYPLRMESLSFYGFDPEIENGMTVSLHLTIPPILMTQQRATAYCMAREYEITANPDDTLTLRNSEKTYTLIPEEQPQTAMSIAEALYKSPIWRLACNGEVIVSGGRIDAQGKWDSEYTESLIFYGFDPKISNGTVITFRNTEGEDPLSWNEAEGTSARTKFKVKLNPDGSITLSDSKTTYTLTPEN